MVISVIALLIGILLPALAAAHTVARQMASQTQLRGIHQGFAAFAGSNRGFYPGLESFKLDDPRGALTDSQRIRSWDGGTGKLAGAHVGARYALGLERDLFPPEYLISPGEVSDAITRWDGSRTDYSNAPADAFYSYALPRLLQSAGVNGKLSQGRALEWQANANPGAVVASDRLYRDSASLTASDPNDPATHRSVWNPAEPGGWSGGVVFSDGHTAFFPSSELDTMLTYAGVDTDGADNLFRSLQVGVQRIPAGADPNQFNAHQIIRGFDQAMFTAGVD